MAGYSRRCRGSVAEHRGNSGVAAQRRKPRSESGSRSVCHEVRGYRARRGQEVPREKACYRARFEDREKEGESSTRHICSGLCSEHSLITSYQQIVSCWQAGNASAGLFRFKLAEVKKTLRWKMRELSSDAAAEDDPRSAGASRAFQSTCQPHLQQPSQTHISDNPLSAVSLNARETHIQTSPLHPKRHIYYAS